MVTAVEAENKATHICSSPRLTIPSSCCRKYGANGKAKAKPMMARNCDAQIRAICCFQDWDITGLDCACFRMIVQTGSLATRGSSRRDSTLAPPCHCPYSS